MFLECSVRLWMMSSSCGSVAEAINLTEISNVNTTETYHFFALKTKNLKLESCTGMTEMKSESWKQLKLITFAIKTSITITEIIIDPSLLTELFPTKISSSRSQNGLLKLVQEFKNVERDKTRQL